MESKFSPHNFEIIRIAIFKPVEELVKTLATDSATYATYSTSEDWFGAHPTAGG